MIEGLAWGAKGKGTVKDTPIFLALIGKCWAINQVCVCVCVCARAHVNIYLGGGNQEL
jgi:hypothetical protein